ncbi:MAG: fibronectin type III domain-containing protein, partial [Elusimicrobiota bacterium]
TLTVEDPSLDAGNTYYFRVASLNWAGQPNYRVLGSTLTVFRTSPPQTLASTYTAVSTYSITAQWDPDDGNPAGTIYNLQASTASNFTGQLYSSSTQNSSFQLYTLGVNATYYFRVNASSKSSVSAYTNLGATCTLAALPGSAVSTFSAVYATSMSVSWVLNGNLVDRTTYTVVLTTGDYYPNTFTGNAVLASTRPAGTQLAATLAALSPLTTYHLFIRSLNPCGASGGFSALGSTVTRAQPPQAASAPFPWVQRSSMTVAWGSNGNPMGVTTYTVVLSTGVSYPNSNDGNVSLSTAPEGAYPSATLEGLAHNATYYLYVAARHDYGAYTSYIVMGATSTLASAPDHSPDAEDYTAFVSGGFTLNWSSGTTLDGFNAPTTYYAQVSLNAGFATVARSSATRNLHADFSGLSVNTTYYARVAAYSNYIGTWTAFSYYGSTATLAAAPLAAAKSFSGVWRSSMSVAWSANGNPVNVTTYTVALSPQTPYSDYTPGNVYLATAPAGAALSATLSDTPLDPNTTYYLSVQALNHNGVGSAFTALAATATWADPPGSPAVSAVYLSSIAVSFLASASAGYELRASSTAFSALAPGGVVYFSSTSDSAATGLSVAGPSALDANTTFYLRLSAYNWNSVRAGIEVSSAATLAQRISDGSQKFAAHGSTSITVNWKPRPSSPLNATCEGYVLEAATAPAAGNSDFTGDIISSVSYGVSLSTLTINELMPGTSYTFRVGTLNHNSAANYTIVGTTKTAIFPMRWTGGGGNTNWYNAANWSPKGIPGPGSPVTIAPAANISVVVNASSPSISFSSLTLGSPAGAYSVNLWLATNVFNGGSILINDQAGLTQASTQHLYLKDDFTMMPGSSLTHVNNSTGPHVSEVDFEMGGIFELKAGAVISVIGRGFAGGITRVTGGGPAGGKGVTTASMGGGGGGHGGAG